MDLFLDSLFYIHGSMSVLTLVPHSISVALKQVIKSSKVFQLFFSSSRFSWLFWVCCISCIFANFYKKASYFDFIGSVDQFVGNEILTVCSLSVHEHNISTAVFYSFSQQCFVVFRVEVLHLSCYLTFEVSDFSDDKLYI